MAHNQGSMLLRRILARELKKLRQQAGMKLEEAAPMLFWSPPTLSRIERAVQGVDVHRVRSMLDLYGESERWEELTGLAIRAGQPGWWEPYKLGNNSYVAFEAYASQVLDFNLGFVPGLLQTADYARALFTSVPVPRTPREVDRAVEARMIRQRRLLSDETPLELVAVIDESVLHRPVGGPDVLRAQLRRLAEASSLNTVSLQVVANTVGAHAGLASSFTLLAFEDLGEPDMAYVEHSLGALLLDKDGDAAGARLTFDWVRDVALNPAESLALIRRLAAQT
ncbi:helix-turn-helix domain-containing protein [Pseudonocardia spinosispora]|uniref:helix-turn-helix domain-containing protein n=1 Tax=Pseudonocardia spinosispora TaxID=103441 RepID=UPI0003FD511F|nr:helix-turn-helix transcriptional regulator [Pseudonocardia spinosispora]